MLHGKETHSQQRDLHIYKTYYMKREP